MMQTEEKPTLYICDPQKNTECKKLVCVHNPDAIYRACAKTKNPAFAVLDENGEPMRAGPKGELLLPIFRDIQADGQDGAESGPPCK
jgi:hypothetical protein